MNVIVCDNCDTWLANAEMLVVTVRELPFALDRTMHFCDWECMSIRATEMAAAAEPDE